MNALAFDDTNFLLSKLMDHGEKERKRHGLTLEKLQSVRSEWNKDRMKHGLHWSINPPQKQYLLSLSKSPALNLQTVQAHLLRQSSLHIGFLWTPPLKVGFFTEPPKY